MPCGRLGIYADMYFVRLLDALREDFPKLEAVVGEGAFRALVADFLEAAPPASPSLRDLGAALPAFLAAHPLGAERPWLHGLAALEWARVDVFDRADAEVLTLEALQTRPPERFAGLPLAAVPALALVDVDAGVEEDLAAARARRGGRRAVCDRGPPGGWRRGSRSITGRPGPKAAALERLVAGVSFGALCEELAAGREAGGRRSWPSRSSRAGRAGGLIGQPDEAAEDEAG